MCIPQVIPFTFMFSVYGAHMKLMGKFHDTTGTWISDKRFLRARTDTSAVLATVHVVPAAAHWQLAIAFDSLTRHVALWDLPAFPARRDVCTMVLRAASQRLTVVQATCALSVAILHVAQRSDLRKC